MREDDDAARAAMAGAADQPGAGLPVRDVANWSIIAIETLAV